MKQETMKKGQTVGESHNDLGENTACSLNLQGNAHHWGKNTLILAGKYHWANCPTSGVSAWNVGNKPLATRPGRNCTSGHETGGVFLLLLWRSDL